MESHWVLTSWRSCASGSWTTSPARDLNHCCRFSVTTILSNLLCQRLDAWMAWSMSCPSPSEFLFTAFRYFFLSTTPSSKQSTQAWAIFLRSGTENLSTTYCTQIFMICGKHMIHQSFTSNSRGSSCKMRSVSKLSIILSIVESEVTGFGHDASAIHEVENCASKGFSCMAPMETMKGNKCRMQW